MEKMKRINSFITIKELCIYGIIIIIVVTASGIMGHMKGREYIDNKTNENLTIYSSWNI